MADTNRERVNRAPERVVLLKGWRRLLVCFVVFAVGALLFAPAVALGAASTPIVSGSSYVVDSLPSTGKISAFNKSLELSYPKNNALVDANKLLATDQSVYFTVYVPGGGSPDYQKYVLVSNIFKISVAAGTYLLEPGQLTLSYDPNVSSAVADRLSIWYSPGISVSGNVYKWDRSGNLNLGGITSTSKHTVTAPFQFSGTGTGYYAVFLGQQVFEEFSAQSDAAWSYPYVMPLWAKGIVEQLPVGSTVYFGLSNNVNRLEFATMMVKGLGLPLTKKPTSASEQIFTDRLNGQDFYNVIPEDIDRATGSTYFGAGYSSASGYKIYDGNHMPVQYAETAARAGIVRGYEDGTFRPQNLITRQEAAVILARVGNLKLSDDSDKVKGSLEALFDDAGEIAPWAAASVLAAVQAKLIVGKPSSDPGSKKLEFDPNGNLTRAEAITMTYRLLKKLKKI